MAPKDEPGKSREYLLGIAVAAIVAAALPHFFFDPPLELHALGAFDRFLGMSVWHPALLAGVAFFFGAGPRDRLDRRELPLAHLTAGCVVVVLAYAMWLAWRFEPLHSQMAGMRPWGVLVAVMAFYAVLRALEVFFWQGLVQRRALDQASRAMRLGVPVVGSLLIFAPYLVVASPGHWYLTGIAIAAGFESAAIATLFELGAPVRVCVVVRASMGAAFIWFQQVTFL